MRSWLRNMCAAQTAQAASEASEPLVSMARQSLNRKLPDRTPVTCERLEDRQLLSASWDVTYTYGGKIKITSGDAKAREAITPASTTHQPKAFDCFGVVSGRVPQIRWADCWR